jgi:hypothetical protein
MVEVQFGRMTKRKRVVVVHKSGESSFHLFGGLIGHDITGKSDVQTRS